MFPTYYSLRSSFPSRSRSCWRWSLPSRSRASSPESSPTRSVLRGFGISASPSSSLAYRPVYESTPWRGNTPLPGDKDAKIIEHPADRWILELYRTVIETLQGIAWLLLVFFAFALIADVIVRFGESKRKSANETPKAGLPPNELHPPNDPGGGAAPLARQVPSTLRPRQRPPRRTPNAWGLDWAPLAASIVRLPAERAAAMDALLAKATIVDVPVAMNGGPLTAEELTLYLLSRISSMTIGCAPTSSSILARWTRRGRRMRGARRHAVGALRRQSGRLNDNIETASPMHTRPAPKSCWTNTHTKDPPLIRAVHTHNIILGKATCQSSPSRPSPSSHPNEGRSPQWEPGHRQPHGPVKQAAPIQISSRIWHWNGECRLGVIRLAPSDLFIPTTANCASRERDPVEPAQAASSRSSSPTTRRVPSPGR